MPDALSIVTGFVGAGGALGVGYAFAKWIIEYIGGRMDKRADRLDADTRFVIDQLRTELGRVEKRLDQAFTEITDLRDQLADCKKQHAKSEARVMQLEAMQVGWGNMRQRAQEIVSAERVADRRRSGDDT